jgi:hypothetical protein
MNPILVAVLVSVAGLALFAGAVLVLLRRIDGPDRPIVVVDRRTYRLAARRIDAAFAERDLTRAHAGINAVCRWLRSKIRTGSSRRRVTYTQLLADLVSSGKLTPIQPVDGGVTYHDPCYLDGHNRVFTPPREVLEASSGGADMIGMPRNSERSFCCGAGGGFGGGPAGWRAPCWERLASVIAASSSGRSRPAPFAQQVLPAALSSWSVWTLTT